MARQYARVKVAIWADDDWRTLSTAAQHLYFLLLTSPSLSHCGVADWRPRRLAAQAAGWSPDDVQAAADELIQRLYLVVDESTEEALIRSFLRHDGLMDQPKMAVAMASAHAAIASATLRGVVVHELNRLREDHPDLKGWGPIKAAEVLSKGSVDPSTYPLGKGSGKGSRKGIGEGNPNPSGKGSGKGCPTPAPAPTPATSSLSAPSVRVADATAAAVPDDAQSLVAEWIDHCGSRPPGRVVGQVAKELGQMLGEGIPHADVRAGLAAWHGRGLHPSALASVVHETRTAAQRTPRLSRREQEQAATDDMYERMMARAAEREAADREAS